MIVSMMCDVSACTATYLVVDIKKTNIITGIRTVCSGGGHMDGLSYEVSTVQPPLPSGSSRSLEISVSKVGCESPGGVRSVCPLPLSCLRKVHVYVFPDGP